MKNGCLFQLLKEWRCLVAIDLKHIELKDVFGKKGEVV